MSAELLEKETDMRRQNEFFSVLEQKGLLTDFQQKWAQQGMRARAEQIARNMKAEGADLHFIGRVTGLTFDEVLNA